MAQIQSMGWICPMCTDRTHVASSGPHTSGLGPRAPRYPCPALHAKIRLWSPTLWTPFPRFPPLPPSPHAGIGLRPDNTSTQPCILGSGSGPGVPISPCAKTGACAASLHQDRALGPCANLAQPLTPGSGPGTLHPHVLWDHAPPPLTLHARIGIGPWGPLGPCSVPHQMAPYCPIKCARSWPTGSLLDQMTQVCRR